MECIVNQLINERWSDPFIRGRERVQIEAEGLGGCRIGEVAGAGECHHVLANETCIITDPNAEPGSVSHRVVEFNTSWSTRRRASRGTWTTREARRACPSPRPTTSWDT
eukprot:6678677-Prymnesium_polylepis.1